MSLGNFTAQPDPVLLGVSYFQPMPPGSFMALTQDSAELTASLRVPREAKAPTLYQQGAHSPQPYITSELGPEQYAPGETHRGRWRSRGGLAGCGWHPSSRRGRRPV